jgi:hypothetical protein
MGSAVEPAGITTELESMRGAGIGGVEITPIYGAGGAESQFVPYLSSRWVDLFEHTLRETGRLGLGADMATGTGWPFGGPWVGDADSARTLVHRTWTLEGGQRLTEPVRAEQQPMVRAVGSTIHEVIETAADRAARASVDKPAPRPGGRQIQPADVREPLDANTNLQAMALEQVKYSKTSIPLLALVARSSDGTVVDLTSRVAPDGTLDWIPPQGKWTLTGAFLGWHGKLVERAAPGGEGFVIDHFSTSAIRHYLTPFDRAFAGRAGTRLRGFFNDSYEVDDATGQADGTPAFLEAFQARRGYDLRRHLAALFSPDGSDLSTRVIADYRETISDLLLETFTHEWRAWAAKRGSIVRNQAHGSPANVLDLYAASDVPETEGTEVARFKWAASAAHVAGRRLVAAEAATWLGEHFRVTLAEVRAALDRFFVAGVNHVVYHGTAYSPADRAWPGWQFYASVEFNPRNTWWTDFRALNDYVARVQSFLQAGRPDHDVLLYYPFYDSIAIAGKERLRHFAGANQPPEGSAFERVRDALQARGYTYDFISDRQLRNLRSDARSFRLQAEGSSRLQAEGGRYQVLILPSSRFIPLETFERAVSLARDGATVVAFGGLPEDVSGLAQLDERRARFRRLRDQIRFGPRTADGIQEARIGRGVVVTGDGLDALLARAQVQRETLVDLGLEFARRTYADGRSYFISNGSAADVDRWIPLADRATAAVRFDPMTGARAVPRVRRSSTGLEVELKLPRASSIVIVTTNAPVEGAVPVADAGAPVPIGGPWAVRFSSGGPELPAPRTIERLASWTTFGGDDVLRFSGTATYTASFPRPPAGDAFELNLGQVRDSARVELNGQPLGTLIGPAFALTVDRSRLATENTLTVHVTNLMANRIAALDRAGVAWRTFYNVNFPARLPQNRGPDGLFSGAGWTPLESGLLGPVTLTALVNR